MLKTPTLVKNFLYKQMPLMLACEQSCPCKLTGKNIQLQYISHKLSPAERNYSIVEKGVPSTEWALESWRYYILGRQFRLITGTKVGIK